MIYYITIQYKKLKDVRIEMNYFININKKTYLKQLMIT